MSWLKDILDDAMPWGKPWERAVDSVERFTDGCDAECCGNPQACSQPGMCELPVQQQLQAAYGSDWEQVYYGNND